MSLPLRSSFGGHLARHWLAKNVEESVHLLHDKDTDMPPTKIVSSKLHLRVLVSLLIAGALILAATHGFSHGREKSETIEASSMGTGTQMGQMFGITVILYEYSTPEDRQILM